MGCGDSPPLGKDTPWYRLHPTQTLSQEVEHRAKGASGLNPNPWALAEQNTDPIGPFPWEHSVLTDLEASPWGIPLPPSRLPAIQEQPQQEAG